MRKCFLKIGQSERVIQSDLNQGIGRGKADKSEMPMPSKPDKRQVLKSAKQMGKINIRSESLSGGTNYSRMAVSVTAHLPAAYFI